MAEAARVMHDKILPENLAGAAVGTNQDHSHVIVSVAPLPWVCSLLMIRVDYLLGGKLWKQDQNRLRNRYFPLITRTSILTLRS